MSAGYIYILENDSLKDMVKIGSTTRDVETRAKELSSSSGVPTPYKIAYKEYVNESADLEKVLHHIFSEYRVSKNREFFRIQAKEVISAIQKLKNNKKYIYNFHHCIDLLPELMKKYKDVLKRDIVFCQFHQCPDIIYVEYGILVKSSNTEWEVISFSNFLDFIVEDIDDDMFKLNNDVNINCQKFLNLDPLSMGICADIFLDEYIQALCEM